MKHSRRNFLRQTAVTAAGLAIPSTWSRAQGANGDVGIAVIGVRGQGNNHLKGLVKRLKDGKTGFRIAAICDADQAVLDERKADLEKASIKAEYYTDFRKLMENKAVDAVIIATPNHLHTLIAMWALEHGKDVYVEKPVSHNIWEGRQLANMAKKHEGKRVCFHGMQRRSDPGWQAILDWVAEGKLGKATLSRGLCYKRRPSIGTVEKPMEAPSTVDYNLWSGPREIMPVKRKQFHYDWHWQWPYGNGDIGNQGPHQLDIARFLIGDPQEGPASVLSIGGNFGFKDDATTAHTQIAFYDFKPIPVIFEVRGLPYENQNFKGRENQWGRSGVGVGNVLHLEGGYICERNVYENGKDDKPIHKIPLNDGSGHMDRWLAALHDRKVPATHGALNGHLSASLAHMANISHRIGKEASVDSIKEQLKSNAAFTETFERTLEHLARNNVETASVKPTMGALLSFDGKAEQFTGENATEANKLAAGDYRQEFALPKVRTSA